MPGICGIVRQQHDLATGPDIHGMLSPLCHHADDTSVAIENPESPISLGAVHLPFAADNQRPIDNSDYSAVFSGEIYNRQELVQSLRSQGIVLDSSTTIWEIFATGVLKVGAAFLKRVDGKFCAAIFDRARQKLLLVTDKFGLKPIYYTATSNQLLFASEIKAILTDPQVSRDQNVRGLAQFFSLGHFWNNETFYDAIRVIPAATVAEYDLSSDHLEFERYWQMAPNPDLSGLTKAEWIERIDDRLKASVDAQTQDTEHLGIALSGGLDARTILGLTDHKQVKMTCFSLGMEGSLDVNSARRLATLAGYPYNFCTLDENFLGNFSQHLERMVELTDGHYLSQCIVLPTFPLIREWGIQVLLRGHAGELMHLNKAYNFSLDRSVWQIRDQASLESWLLNRLSAYMLEAVDGPLLVQANSEERETLVRESLREALQATSDWDVPINRISQLFLTQRLRRETALSLMKFQSVTETRLPFMDSRLIELLLSCPPELRMGETLQAAMLRRHNPEFLAPPNSNTGARVGAPKLVRQAALFRMKVLAKLGVKGHQPYERLGLWLRTSLRPLVEKILLSPECLDRGVFVPETVKSVVKQHSANERNHTFLILSMMIFEMGQRRFADQLPAEFSAGSHVH